MKSQVYLITGASGWIGRRVVELLLEANIGRIIVTSRYPDQLAYLEKRNVEVRYADFEDPYSFSTAFAGVDRMLLICPSNLDRLGERFTKYHPAIMAARRAGIKYIAFITSYSFITAFVHSDAPMHSCLAPDHSAIEHVLATSGINWTTLRNNWYTETLFDLSVKPLVNEIAQGKQAQLVGIAPADTGAAYVTREDCARCAAAILTSEDMSERVLEITGPAKVTFEQLADIIANLTGNSVQYVRISPEEFKERLLHSGLTEHAAELVISGQQGIAQGKFDRVSHAVQELTGRDAKSVVEFLNERQELFTTF